MEMEMFTKTIAAAVLLATAALVSGSASTALAQYASPGPTYVPEGYSVPYGYNVPNGYVTPYQRRGARDTNGW
jgi:hypothetical protein